MSLKYSISSPLEAGTSILEGALPSRVNSALEYVSKRLDKKDVHLTLVVVRRDYQLPSPADPLKPISVTATPPASNVSTTSGWTKHGHSGFSLSSIKHIVRSNSFPLGRLSSNTDVERRTVEIHPSCDEGLRTGMISPAFSVSSLSSMASTVSTTSTVQSSIGGSRAWPLSPTTPFSSTTPATPATPYSDVSMVTHTNTDTSSVLCEGPPIPATFGIKLVHTSPVSSREEKVLKQIMQKAERKFHLGPSWFPPAVAPSECGLTADLIHRSLEQNEIIFTSEGLSLLTLDHLYTFKSALASYAATQQSCMLEDAVDELRRLVLARGGQKLRKSVLQSSFTWVGPVSDSALSDVIRMYRRAYGGKSSEGGIEHDLDASTTDISTPAAWPLPDQPIFMIGSGADDKPLPALPDDAWQSASDTPSESGESSGWESEDFPSLTLSRTNSNRIQKRFAVIGLDARQELDYDVEDYYRLSAARDLLIERAETEAIAWAGAGASGEEADLADGTLVIALTDLKVERPLARGGSPHPDATEDIYFLPHSPDGAEKGRMTPKVERPRLQLQTSVPSPSLGITKPVALRMPALKLQTSFTDNPVLAKPVPTAPLSRRLTLSGAETTLNLVGMTPIEGRLPNFDSLLAGRRKSFEDDEDGELTAKPISGHPGRQHRWTQRWNHLGIDGRLSDAAPPSALELQADKLGPMTPNGYEDISPVTRGEWGFLFQGETWLSGRTVTVETC